MIEEVSNRSCSVSETLEAIKMAHKAGYTAISSHRSGETADTTIADLAAALRRIREMRQYIRALQHLM